MPGTPGFKGTGFALSSGELCVAEFWPDEF
jgi:hypothetical protein